jgi:CheY-like chemotaxis protein
MSRQPPRVKILVVDDEYAMRELLVLHLRNAGYAVSAAEDAIEAAHLIVHEAPDLAIIDVYMPYVSGYEFVSALKSDPDTRHVPVVFVTSADDVDDYAIKLGAAAYLRKPFRANQLLEVVRLFTRTA